MHKKISPAYINTPHLNFMNSLNSNLYPIPLWLSIIANYLVKIQQNPYSIKIGKSIFIFNCIPINEFLLIWIVVIIRVINQ